MPGVINLSIQDIIVAVAECAKKIPEINARLTNYYITDGPLPRDIAEFASPLNTLQINCEKLKSLNFNSLESLVDDPECCASKYVHSIISDLLNAANGFKNIIEARYDPNLSARAPYAKTVELLQDLQSQLTRLVATKQSDAQRPKAFELVALEGPLTLCKGAIQILNGDDNGEVDYVKDKELSAENDTYLRKNKGRYLWWKCTSCDFQIKFWVKRSATSTISLTEEIKSHPGLSVKYRSISLAKSHLFRKPPGRTLPSHKYGCTFCVAHGQRVEKGKTAFASGKDLAQHIRAQHVNPLPAQVLLNKMNVSIGGNALTDEKVDIYIPGN